MRHAARALVWLVAAGCTVGSPAGFSSGDHWTFPLVGPLEDGLLMTPAMVHGHGPYLFAIDPDANVTEIDKPIVDEAELRMGSGPHLIDETDTGRVRFFAELLDLRVADLAVERRDAMVFPSGFYDVDGRHIQGILGRDVIADSLVFGFDRDQGIATLTTVHAFKPPPQVIALRYETISGNAVGLPPEIEPKYDPERKQQEAVSAGGATPADMTPVPRRLATAQIGGSTFAMHLDLGARTSQLAESRWSKARLSPTDAQVRVVDEAATAREMHSAAVAEVTVGDNRREVTFTPYVEKRFGDHVDGALGLDFFRPYSVYASWDSKTYFLKLRGDTAATTTARLGRWGAAIPACPHTGCVALALAAGGGGPEGGSMLDVTRDAEARGRALEVFVGVTPAAGRAATSLVVELPSGVDRTTAVLPADYAGATLAVLDASPFVRACPGTTGCVLRSAASAH
jgi:aspartyl protease